MARRIKYHDSKSKIRRDPPISGPTLRTFVVKRAGSHCAGCGIDLGVGESALYVQRGQYMHEECPVSSIPVLSYRR